MGFDAKKLYEESVVIDTACPLCSYQDSYKRYQEGGVTIVTPTVYPLGGYLPETIDGITFFYDIFKKDPSVAQILSVDDIYNAKKENKIGFIMCFQGCSHLQANLKYIEIYYRLGVRIMQLCYNMKNALGDGCTEPGNGGLSIFGEKAIKEMNRIGILVDLSHTGYRTTMEAMEASDKPVVFSHGNSYSVFNSKRNLMDEQVIKVAKMGGTVGVNGYPYFLGSNNRGKMSDYLDHIDYYVKLLGIEHVTMGMDYYKGTAGIMNDDEAVAYYNKSINAGIWSRDTYPEPPYYWPEEVELPEKIPNIVPALKSRGYAPDDIKKILGENYIRVLKEVWK